MPAVFRKLRWCRAGWMAAAVVILLANGVSTWGQETKWYEWQSLNDDAVKYGERAEYDLAIPFARMALKAAETGPSSAVAGQGPKDERVVMCLQTLAGLYERTGRYPDAEPLLKRASDIGEKAPGAGAETQFAQTLTSLAALYYQTTRYAEAAAAAKRAEQLMKKTEVRADNDAYMVPILDILAALSIHDGHYDQAEQFLKQAKDILAFAGYNSAQQSPTLYLIALCDLRQGKYSDAEMYAAIAWGNFQEAYGPDHPGLARYALLRALIFLAEHKESAAEKYFDQDLAILVAQFESAFAYMSERDRLRLIETVQMTFRAYFAFCLSRSGTTPEVAARMFDFLLWEKGMVAQSVGAMWAQIAASGDAQGRELVTKLATAKTKYAQLVGNPGSDLATWAKQVEDLSRQVNDIEEELARLQASSAKQKSRGSASWRDVQKQLGDSDAAVEFAHFVGYDGKSLTGKACYVALVVTSRSANPALVELGAAANLEGAGLRGYRSTVAQRGVRASTASGVPGIEMYRAFWQPLEPYLRGAQRVYVSPDGVLDEVPLGILPDESNKLLGERYDLRIVASTRDLLDRRVTGGSAAENTAVLIGNPQFDLTTQAQRSALAKLSAGSPSPPLAASLSPLDATLSRDQTGGNLPPLPGTQMEIEAIKNELDGEHWHVQTYVGPMALEEVLKRVRSPRLLHIATHGFFESDEQLSEQDTIGTGRGSSPTLEDPMLRSGLYLAAADRALAHQPAPQDLDDGVLTAYEASTLNLEGTELVILSACETGLGEIANGEGVFGLRRAFQLAGAHYIVMSLWSVPDHETQELMQDFLRRWLRGEEIHAAFRDAQEQERSVVRSRYHVDDPFYWGAFILVGN